MLRGIAPLGVIKSEDEDRTTTTTLQADEELFLAIPASTSWLWVCYLDYEGGANGASDLKIRWNGPGTISYWLAGSNASSLATIIGQTFAGNSAQVLGTNGAGNLRGALIVGTIVAGVDGDLALSTCQNTSSSTPTIVHAGSALAAWEITA
jgi:hypothetical protein